MTSALFPSLKGGAVLRLLTTGLGYEVVRQRGSHRRLEAPGRPALTFAYHDGDTVPPGLLRNILVRQVGLSLDEALEVVGRG